MGHMVRGTFRAADLFDGQTLVTLSGETLVVSVSAGAVTVSTPLATAAVIRADVAACASVVHTIDSVLVFATDDVLGGYGAAALGGYGAADAAAGTYGISTAGDDSDRVPEELGVADSGVPLSQPAPPVAVGPGGSSAAVVAGAVFAGAFLLLAVGAGVTLRWRHAATAAGAARRAAGVSSD